MIKKQRQGLPQERGTGSAIRARNRLYFAGVIAHGQTVVWWDAA